MSKRSSRRRRRLPKLLALLLALLLIGSFAAYPAYATDGKYQVVHNQNQNIDRQCMDANFADGEAAHVCVGEWDDNSYYNGPSMAESDNQFTASVTVLCYGPGGGVSTCDGLSFTWHGRTGGYISAEAYSSCGTLGSGPDHTNNCPYRASDSQSLDYRYNSLTSYTGTPEDTACWDPTKATLDAFSLRFDGHVWNPGLAATAALNVCDTTG